MIEPQKFIKYMARQEFKHIEKNNEKTLAQVSSLLIPGTQNPSYGYPEPSLVCSSTTYTVLQ